MWVLRRLRWRTLVGAAFLVTLSYMLTSLILGSPSARSSNFSSGVVNKNSLFVFEDDTPLSRQGSSANHNVPDADAFIKTFFQHSANNENTLFRLDVSEPYNDLLMRLNKHKKKGVMLMRYKNLTRVNNSRDAFHQGINQYYLYDPMDNQVILNLLKEMNTEPIVYTENKASGTQFKLMLTFANGGKGIFKPRRVPRVDEAPPDTVFWHLFERPEAEIAAFHLDRILGFHRTPPVVGRVLNMTTDIRDVSEPWLANTFFNSTGGRVCLTGFCIKYCDENYPVCGDPDTLEGSVVVSLPLHAELGREHMVHPWRPSYIVNQTAVWEDDETYCESQVKVMSPYNESRLLLDLMDMSVFDFLMDNIDRHHNEAFNDIWPDTFVLHLDNGKGFARSYVDTPSRLAPIRQCCMIRLSTVVKLIKLYQGPDSLSQLMAKSLNFDPLAPILTEAHLDALDRRVGQVFKVIKKCIDGGKPWKEVLIDDRVT